MDDNFEQFKDIAVIATQICEIADERGLLDDYDVKDSFSHEIVMLAKKRITEALEMIK